MKSIHLHPSRRLVLRSLAARGPASVNVCGLLVKERERDLSVPVAYTGFTIPDRFVVGYGLDYAERYRNVPYIGVLKPDVYEHDVPEIAVTGDAVPG